MPGSNTGSEVLAYCGSCKMDLTAVIVAKVGAKIARVQCKTCKGERAYKPPKGVSEPGAEATVKPTRVKKASTDAAPKSVSFEAEWNRLMGEAGKAARVPYSTKAQLKLGDVIKHPTFGEGIVTRVSFPDKAEVLFQTDMKLLIHSRS